MADFDWNINGMGWPRYCSDNHYQKTQVEGQELRLGTIPFSFYFAVLAVCAKLEAFA